MSHSNSNMPLSFVMMPCNDYVCDMTRQESNHPVLNHVHNPSLRIMAINNDRPQRYHNRRQAHQHHHLEAHDNPNPI